MWDSENKLLRLYRATGKFGILPQEVRIKISEENEEHFTVPIRVKEQREAENYTDRSQIRPDEIKSCHIYFALSRNNHFKNISTTTQVQTVFQQNNIPIEWIRTSIFDSEIIVTVQWLPTFRENKTFDLVERHQEWINSGNTLESFPLKAVHLFTRTTNVIQNLLDKPTLYRKTVTMPPDIMTYLPWKHLGYTRLKFTCNGSVTFSYIPQNLRLIDKWFSNVNINESNP